MKNSQLSFKLGICFQRVCVLSLFSFWAQSGFAFVTNQNADLVIGQPDMTSNAINQGTSSAWNNTLSAPRFLSYNNAKLYVADSGNYRVLIYNSIPTANDAPADIVVGQPNMTSNTAPTSANDITLSAYSTWTYNNNLFVADNLNNRVLIFNPIPTTNGAAASMVIGQPNMTSSQANQGAASAGPNTLNIPFSVFADSSGLYVADYGNHRVLVYTSTLATNMPADKVIGQPNLTSNAANQGLAAPAANTLYNPIGVFKQGANLFVSDNSNHRCLIYTLPLPAANANANLVVGQANLTSANSVASSTVLNAPHETYSDGTMLAIVDGNVSRIMIYNQIPTVNGAAADAVLGQQDMTSTQANQGLPAPAANTLNSPRGLTSDGTNLLIGDNTNNRILICHPPTPTNTPTYTATATFTTTPTRTPIFTRTVTPTITPTSTITVTITKTTTATITLTPLPTSTITPYESPRDQVLAYPSPATGKDLWFYYFSPEATHVRLEIFTLMGEPCKTIEDDIAAAGYARTHWDISKVAPGIYFYRLTLEHAGTSTTFPIRKLVIVKK